MESADKNFLLLYLTLKENPLRVLLLVPQQDRDFSWPGATTMTCWPRPNENPCGVLLSTLLNVFVDQLVLVTRFICSLLSMELNTFKGLLHLIHQNLLNILKPLIVLLGFLLYGPICTCPFLFESRV